MQPADASVLESQDQRLEQDLISLSFFMEMIPLACEGSSQPGSALHVEGQAGSRWQAGGTRPRAPARLWVSVSHSQGQVGDTVAAGASQCPSARPLDPCAWPGARRDTIPISGLISMRVRVMGRWEGHPEKRQEAGNIVEPVTRPGSS